MKASYTVHVMEDPNVETATEASTEPATESATQAADEPTTQSPTVEATQPDTEIPTEAATQPAVETPTQEIPSVETQPQDKTGCSSAALSGAAVLCIMNAAVALKRKEN